MGVTELRTMLATAYSLAVEFKSDAGVWVDFNLPYPGGSYPDYWAGLVNKPTIQVKPEGKRHQYIATVDQMEFDNRPWAGKSYGFWDAPLPVTVKRSGTSHVFTNWRRRQVRLSITLYDSAGTLINSTAIGIWRVDRVKRKKDKASITFVTANKVLMDARADTVKNGNVWYKNLPITALIKILALSADPSISLGPELASGTVLDLGLFPSLRVTSWGSTPGVNTGAWPPCQRWITKSSFAKPSSNQMIFGFEAVSAAARPAGGVASFDVSTGRWLVHVSDANLSDGATVIALYQEGSYIYFVTLQERTPTPSSYQFYAVYFKRCSLGQNVTPTDLGNAQNYWPCRETLRKGVDEAGLHNISKVGCESDVSGSNTFFGEPLECPFPQVIDSFSREMIGGSYETNFATATWASLRPQDRYDPNGGIAPWEQIPLPAGPGAGGAWFSQISLTVAQTFGAWRIFMGSDIHPPALVQESFMYWCYLTFNSSPSIMRFIVQWVKVSDGALTYQWTCSNAGNSTNQMWADQPSAWDRAPGGTVRQYLFCFVEWNEIQNTGIPWSRVYMGIMDATGLGGTGDMAWSEIWSWTPSGANAYQYAPLIVRIFTPRANATPYSTAQAWSVCVVFNRGDMSGACYGLGIVRKSGGVWRWLQLPGRAPGSGSEPVQAYTGPASSIAFSSFVEDPTDGKLLFVDQATGILHSVEVNTSTWVVTWNIENVGIPIHGSEFHTTMPVGGRMTSSDDGKLRYFFGGAPNLPGEIRLPHYSRPGVSSLDRMEAGIYPLLMYSTVPADCVEVADFSGLSVLQAIQMLAEIAWKYRLWWDNNQTLRLTLRQAGAADYTLKRRSTEGEADPLALTFAYDDAVEVEVLEEETYNTVQVTPYVLQVNQSDNPQPIAAVGSTFRGNFITSITSERPTRVTAICAIGGDVREGWAASNTNGTLFRYSQVPETSSLLLNNPADATDNTIRVVNLRGVGGRAFVGDQQIQIGDYVTVRGGNTVRITAIDSTSIFGSVQLTLDGPIGETGFSAPVWSEVILQPAGGAVSSDGPDGIGFLTNAMATGATSFTTEGAGCLRGGASVVKIGNEFMVVTQVLGTTVTVTRAAFGTVDPGASYPVSTKIRAYVWVRKPGVLYPIGNTGASVGVQIADDAELADRTITAGDGVLISGKGIGLVKAEHATVKAVDNENLIRTGARELPIDNRFIDPVKAVVIADTTLGEVKNPLTRTSNVGIPLVPDISINTSVYQIDRRALCSANPSTVEVESLLWNLRDQRMLMNLLTFDSIVGSGKSEGPGVGGGGEVLPGGRE